MKDANRTIEELGLSVRTYNSLKRYGINFEDEIRKMTFEDVRKVRNIGRSSVEEIERRLKINFV